jgi:ribose 5-phosphate isomerase B
MKIVIGSDHRGVKLKSAITKFLSSKGHEVTDVGTYTEDSCDYPVYCVKAGEMVAAKTVDTGIFICYTGIGSSIALNKIKGVRASLVGNVKAAKLTRQHNDSNMLVLGSAFLTQELALRIVSAYIKSEFEGGRHTKRVDMVNAIESGCKFC